MTGTIRALTQANAARLRQRVTEVRCVSSGFVSSSAQSQDPAETPDLARKFEHLPRSTSRGVHGMTRRDIDPGL